MSNTWEQLVGPNLGEYSYEEILKHNVIAMFDWGFVNKNGFVNVSIPKSGAYGADFSRLRNIVDPRFTTGTVWEAPRKNWVWESGLDCSQPVSISGVFVGSTYYPASGNQFYVDYPNGRIVFNSAVPTTSVVRVAYPYKWIDVTDAYNISWDKIIQQGSFRPDANFTSASGSYIGLADSRVQLPMVGVEVVETQFKGYEIGGAKYNISRIKYHIIAEDASSVDRIAGMIAAQDERSVFMFDTNLLVRNNRFPLNNFGSIASGAMTYNQMVAESGRGGYRYVDVLGGLLTFMDTRKQSIQKLTNNIYRTTVDMNSNAVISKYV